jgi:hypothetical protein
VGILLLIGVLVVLVRLIVVLVVGLLSAVLVSHDVLLLGLRVSIRFALRQLMVVWFGTQCNHVVLDWFVRMWVGRLSAALVVLTSVSLVIRSVPVLALLGRIRFVFLILA